MLFVCHSEGAKAVAKLRVATEESPLGRKEILRSRPLASPRAKLSQDDTRRVLLRDGDLSYFIPTTS